MGLGKNFGTGILSLFLILFLSLIIMFLSLNSLLYPSVYKDVFEKNDFYGFLENSMDKTGGGTFILFENGVKTTVDSLFANFLSYIRGDSDNPDLKVKIDQEKLRDFLEENVKDFPSCISGQESFDKNNDVVCKPSGKTDSEFLDEVLEKKNMTFFESDSVDLADVYGLSNPEFQKIRSYVILYKWILYSLFFLALIALAFIFLASEKSFLSTFKIFGAALFVSGVSIVVSVLILNSSSGVIVENIQTPQDFTILKDLVSDILSAITGKMNFYGYSIIGAGAIIFAVFWFLKRKKAEV